MTRNKPQWAVGVGVGVDVGVAVGVGIIFEKKKQMRTKVPKQLLDQ